MGFEFIESGGHYYLHVIPTAIILSKNGLIRLNKAACDVFGIKQNAYCKLGYDKEKNLVAIKMLKNYELGSRKITRPKNIKNQSGCISAMAFLKHFNLLNINKKMYELKKQDDMLIFKVDFENKND